MSAESFDRLRAGLATAFVRLPAEQIDGHVAGALAQIGAFLELERVTLYELSNTRAELTADQWCSDGAGAPRRLTRADDGSHFKKLLERAGVFAADPAALPVVWAASIPLAIGGETIGALQVASTTRPRPWNGELSDQLGALAEVFANALVRKRTARALHATSLELQKSKTEACEREQRSRLAEAALAASGGRLMEAQEVERSRIARELHDDICQRLAVLAIEIQQLDASAPAEVPAIAEALLHRTVDISTDVQALSHQLHCSKLEFLGIVAAIRGFCVEFARQQAATIEFTSSGVPTHLPRDVSLCLFRVVQEALRNAVKHSGVSHVEVQLHGTSTMVVLTIRDRGRGFELDEAMRGHGLGLVSMRERVSLVKGTIAVTSTPGAGAEICLRIPMGAGSERRGTPPSSAKHVYLIPSGRAS